MLPGYPGPYGDKALYYLVPLKDGSILEIVAPKSYIEDAQQEQPTHYDTVIRGLIESLRVSTHREVQSVTLDRSDVPFEETPRRLRTRKLPG